MVWVKGNVFSRGLHRRYRVALRNPYVCEVVQVGTWLEVGSVVSSPWVLLMAPASGKSQGPLAWGQ